MKPNFQSSGDANRLYELLWEWTQILRSIDRNTGMQRIDAGTRVTYGIAV